MVMLVDFKHGTAAKAASAEQAAELTLASEQADAVADSEQERREFVKARAALVNERVQKGLGFAS